MIARARKVERKGGGNIGGEVDGDKDHVVDVELVFNKEDDVDDEVDHVNDKDLVVDKEDHGDNEDLVGDEDLVDGESTRRTGLGRQVFLLYDKTLN